MVDKMESKSFSYVGNRVASKAYHLAFLTALRGCCIGEHDDVVAIDFASASPVTVDVGNI